MLRMWKKPGETKKIEKRKKRRVLELFGVKKRKEISPRYYYSEQVSRG
jgi:hypothetical protein